MPRILSSAAVTILLMCLTPQASAQFDTRAPIQTPRSQALTLTDDKGELHVLGGFTTTASNELPIHEIYSERDDTWRTGPSMLVPVRGACGVTGPDGRLYVFGGFNNGHRIDTQIFDPNINRWLPGARSTTTHGWMCAAAVGADENIYVFGGQGGSDKVSIYNWQQNAWSQGPDMPQNRYAHGASPLRDGRIYLYGGFDSQALDSMTIFDPENNTFEAGADLPEARTHFGWTQKYGRYLFVIGGSSTQTNLAGPYFKEVFVYDRQKGTWELHGDLLQERRSPTAGGFGTGLFVTGGNSGDPIDETERSPVQANVLVWAASSTGNLSTAALNSRGEITASFLRFSTAHDPSTIDGFDAVLAFTVSSVSSTGDQYGDILADYIDAGGGVVEATFGNFSDNFDIAGRYREQHACVDTTTSPYGGGTVTGNTILVPSHALAWGLDDIDIPNFRTGDAGLKPGCKAIVNYTDQQLFSGANDRRLGRAAWVGFYPESTNGTENRYDALTNAVRWSLSGRPGRLINVAPSVDAGGPYTVNEGSSVTLSATASDPNEDPLDFAWDLDGDNQFDDAFVQSPTFTGLDGPATHTVRVRVTDPSGLNVIDTATVTVNNVIPAFTSLLIPPAIFESAPNTYRVTTSDPAGTNDTVTVTWTFGDGNSATGHAVSHTFTDEGSYQFTILAEDDDGGRRTLTGTFNVRDVIPSLSEVLVPDQVFEGASNTYSAQVTRAASDAVLATWSWGDGSANNTRIFLPGAASFTINQAHTYPGQNGVRTLTLTLRDDDNNTVQRTADVEVLNVAPQITNIQGPINGTEGEALSFDATAFDAGGDTLTFTWDFGDGTPTSSGASVTHTYADNGVYTGTLTVTDGDGGSDTETRQITIANAAPQIDSLTGDTQGPEASQFTYQATASDAGADTLTFRWDFGDGTPSASGGSVAHTYADDGDYTLTLTVTDDDGSSDTDTLAIEVSNVAPQINAFTAPESGTEGQTLDFSAAASDVAGQNDPLTFTWNFGDGTPSVSGTSPSHTYADDGAFTLTLTVEDDDGGITERSQTVDIANADPRIQTFVGDFAGIEDDTFSYAATVTDAGDDTLTFTWDFGDGSDPLIGVDLDQVDHIYTESGTFALTLTVTDEDGGSAQLARDISVGGSEPVITNLGGDTEGSEGQAMLFTAEAFDPNGDAINYTWSFGDGSAPVSGIDLQAISHTYAEDGAYTLTLTVSDGQGSTSASIAIEVENEAPQIVALQTPEVLNEGLVGNFTVIVVDPGGLNDPLSFDWSFGDGNSASDASVTHAYANDGQYTITITVTDDEGAQTTTTRDITVNNVAPSVSPLVLPSPAREGQALTFTASVSDPGANDALTFTWDFGDGTTRVGEDLSTVEHTYADDGTFTVRLEVNDGTATTARSANLRVTNEDPVIQTLDGDTEGTEGQTLSYSANAVDPGPADVLTYTWTFGDGSAPVSGQNLSEVEHTFTDAGNFEIRLVVTDGDGGLDTRSLNVDIDNGAPQITALQGPDEGDEGQSLDFVAAAVDPGGDPLTFTWDFGDGSEPVSGLDLSSISHAYPDQGSFTLLLSVTDGVDTDTDTLTIDISNVAPTLQDLQVPSEGTEALPLTFRAAAQDPGGENDPLTFEWDFGDGNTATGAEVSHTYADDDTYTVQITVTDGDGGQITDTATIDINNAAPIIGLFQGPDEVVEGSEAAFIAEASDTIADPLTFTWAFEEGPSPSGVDLTEAAHTYPDDGSFEIQLIVDDGDGGQTEQTRTLTVLNANPIIGIIAGDFFGQEGDSYDFSATASDPGDDTLTFNWDFGDGTTASGASVSHTYTERGEYILRLEVLDEDGGIASAERSVGVDLAAPIITVLGGDTEGDEGQDLNFAAEAVDPTGDPITFLWNFGDGSEPVSGVDLNEVQHTYAEDGTYQVSLTVSDQEGSTSGVLNITISNAAPTIDLVDVGDFAEGAEGTLSATASDPGGENDPLTFSWTFGDGSEPAEGAQVSHTYAASGTFTATLTVTDDEGARDIRQIEVLVLGAPPIIAAVEGTFEGDEGERLTFTVSALDPGGDTLSYEWSFDEGEPIPTDVPELTIAFPDDGTIEGLVRVIDTDGLASEQAFEVSIDNVAPSLDNLSGPRRGDEGTLFAFEAQASDPAEENDPLTFAWDFGDGTLSIEGLGINRVEHTYADDGAYTLTLTITDDEGGQTIETFDIEVANVAPGFASITGPRGGSEGQSLAFQAEAQDPGGENDPLTFTWDFGDGSEPVTGVEVEHTYADDGDYDLTLSVADDEGASVEIVRVISVENVAPIFVTTPPLEATGGQIYTYDIEVEDPGDDTLTLVLDEGPEGMALDGNQITWTPTNEQVAQNTPFDVAVTVADDEGAEALQQWQLQPTFTDADEDGVPDECEIEFGLDPEDPLDGDIDQDRDGLTNRAECIAGTDPTTFNGPSAPTINSPTDGDRVDTFLPELKVNNARDPDGDALTYTYDLFRDPDLIELVASYTNVPEGINTTAHAVEQSLEENRTYFWRARAADPFVNGDFSPVVSFLVDTVNDPPTTPEPLLPEGAADSPLPRFEVSESTDPEGDPITYLFEVYADKELTELVFDGESDEPAFDTVSALEEGGTYFWRTAARDDREGQSPFSEALEFVVDSFNALPGPPTITTPEQGETVLDPQVEIRWRNALDLDEDPLTYELEVATDEAFTEIVFSRTDIGEQPDETGFLVEGLEEDGSFFARVRATDGKGFGTFDEVAFRLNAENSPPPVPELVSPDEGEFVDPARGFELVLANSLDPDGDAVVYDFFITADPEGEEILFEVRDVAEGASGQTTAQVDGFEAPEQLKVFWTAVARDALGLESDLAPSRSLEIGVEVSGDLDTGEDCGCVTLRHGSAPGGGMLWWVLVAGVFALGLRRGPWQSLRERCCWWPSRRSGRGPGA